MCSVLQRLLHERADVVSCTEMPLIKGSLHAIPGEILGQTTHPRLVRIAFVRVTHEHVTFPSLRHSSYPQQNRSSGLHNAAAQGRAGTMLAKHDDASRRVPCSRRSDDILLRRWLREISVAHTFCSQWASLRTHGALIGHHIEPFKRKSRLDHGHVLIHGMYEISHALNWKLAHRPQDHFSEREYAVKGIEIRAVSMVE